VEGLRELLAVMTPAEFRAAARKRELEEWRAVNRFCGKCGGEMRPHENPQEQAFVCPRCGYAAYPKISPAVIVLVTRGDKTSPLVFCLPAHREIDLRVAAAVTGNKKLEMIHVKDLLALTGYIRGGCSPIGMKKKFPTYFHASALEHERITVSAGCKGIQLLIKVDELLRFTEAQVAEFCTPE
jgi:Cys-tRNA(Pro) deacylase